MKCELHNIYSEVDDPMGCPVCYGMSLGKGGKAKSLLKLIDDNMLWECGDCKNVYDLTVASCPNDTFLHQVNIIMKRK